jgi:hypothetical protein
MSFAVIAVGGTSDKEASDLKPSRPRGIENIDRQDRRAARDGIGAARAVPHKIDAATGDGAEGGRVERGGQLSSAQALGPGVPGSPCPASLMSSPPVGPPLRGRREVGSPALPTSGRRGAPLSRQGSPRAERPENGRSAQPGRSRTPPRSGPRWGPRCRAGPAPAVPRPGAARTVGLAASPAQAARGMRGKSATMSATRSATIRGAAHETRSACLGQTGESGLRSHTQPVPAGAEIAFVVPDIVR